MGSGGCSSGGGSDAAIDRDVSLGVGSAAKEDEGNEGDKGNEGNEG